MQFVGLGILWNDTRGLYPFCSNTSGFISRLKRLLNVKISIMVFLFSIPCKVDFPYRMEDFDTQFEFSDVISRLSFYHLLVSLKSRDKIVEGPRRC